MVIQPKGIYTFNALLIKISMTFYSELQHHPEIYVEAQIASSNAGGITIPKFNIYY
jgi:hypothetical protein